MKSPPMAPYVAMRNSLDCETRLNCLKRHSRKRNKLTSDSPKLQSASTSKQRKPSRKLAPKSEPVGKHERLDNCVLHSEEYSIPTEVPAGCDPNAARPWRRRGGHPANPGHVEAMDLAHRVATLERFMVRNLGGFSYVMRIQRAGSWSRLIERQTTIRRSLLCGSSNWSC